MLHPLDMQPHAQRPLLFTAGLFVPRPVVAGCHVVRQPGQALVPAGFIPGLAAWLLILGGYCFQAFPVDGGEGAPVGVLPPPLQPHGQCPVSYTHLTLPTILLV